MKNEEDIYPRITNNQIEVWLASPVTKTLIQCITWEWENVRERAGESALVADPANADLSHALVHEAKGRMGALRDVQSFEKLMRKYEMVEHERDNEEG